MRHLQLFEDFSGDINEGAIPVYNENDFKKNLNAAPVQEIKYSQVIEPHNNFRSLLISRGVHLSILALYLLINNNILLIIKLVEFLIYFQVWFSAVVDICLLFQSAYSNIRIFKIIRSKGV